MINNYACSNSYFELTLIYYNPKISDENGNIIVANENIPDMTPKVCIVCTNSQLHVSLEDDVLFDTTIYNMHGMLVVQRKDNRDKATISLNGLPQGIYIVYITSGGYTYSQKIII
ncbi:MAG: T9SS type A sorting domain-containing protein [Tannerella sp.]|jgi:hypothetical protein|nr:T9SS type A sorting domain-containing protein [Tannerella sp.]